MAGPYVTGECPTIELALKEMQMHLETYHESDFKKSLRCFVQGCTFETELLPNESAVEYLKIHVNICHQKDIKPKTKVKSDSDEGKAVFKAVKCNIVYKKNQTFESFEKEIDQWKKVTIGLQSHVRDMMFVESIGNAENEEVKDYYTRNLMNNDSVPKTIDEIMNKLKDKFGKNPRQKWDDVFARIKDFNFGEKNPKQAWEELEVNKFNVKDVWKSNNDMEPHNDANYLLDKMLIRSYLSKGIQERKFEKAIVPKLEEDIEKVRYNWNETKKILTASIFDYQEKDNIQTHFTRGNEFKKPYDKRRSRS